MRNGFCTYLGGVFAVLITHAGQAGAVAPLRDLDRCHGLEGLGGLLVGALLSMGVAVYLRIRLSKR